MVNENEYTPWCNDWMCPECKNCNRGRDNFCTTCGKPIPTEIWLNRKHPKQREYCKNCGRKKPVTENPAVKPIQILKK